MQVGDFGLSKEMLDDQHMTTLAMNPVWLAPEVLDRKPYGFPADVYSFSIVLWELLTLLTPWDQESIPRHRREFMVSKRLLSMYQLHHM